MGISEKQQSLCGDSAIVSPSPVQKTSRWRRKPHTPHVNVLYAYQELPAISWGDICWDVIELHLPADSFLAHLHSRNAACEPLLVHSDFHVQPFIWERQTGKLLKRPALHHTGWQNQTIKAWDIFYSVLKANPNPSWAFQVGQQTQGLLLKIKHTLICTIFSLFNWNIYTSCLSVWLSVKKATHGWCNTPMISFLPFCALFSSANSSSPALSESWKTELRMCFYNTIISTKPSLYQLN